MRPMSAIVVLDTLVWPSQFHFTSWPRSSVNSKCTKTTVEKNAIKGNEDSHSEKTPIAVDLSAQRACFLDLCNSLYCRPKANMRLAKARKGRFYVQNAVKLSMLHTSPFITSLLLQDLAATGEEKNEKGRNVRCYK